MLTRRREGENRIRVNSEHFIPFPPSSRLPFQPSKLLFILPTHPFQTSPLLSLAGKWWTAWLDSSFLCVCGNVWQREMLDALLTSLTLIPQSGFSCSSFTPVSSSGLAWQIGNAVYSLLNFDCWIQHYSLP